MPIVIIEFYDSGVRICDGINILADSVSCALIEADKTILVGERAALQAHLRPRENSTLFWSQLSENSETKHAISNAEIALRHLEHIWNSANCSDQDAILVTPVSLEKHDLGLLLGICKKLSINVTGIVCNATLAMQQPGDNCKAVFLDLLQQQLVITEIIQNEAGISLNQPSHILDYGLHDFNASCANYIARKFISETRFDPLHSANDEQQFYDKLPLWLVSLAKNDSIECKLNTGDKHFVIKIQNEALQIANKKKFEEIAAYLNVLFKNHNNIAIFCSSACKQVFGLKEFLANLPGCAMIQLDKISIAGHALRCSAEIISGEQIHFVNSLSWCANYTSTALDFNPGKLSNLASIPTHILINGHAYSLQKSIFIANSDVTTEPRIMLDESQDSICKIVANSLSVEIHALGAQPMMLNKNRIEKISTAKIGDVLIVESCEMDCLFIKVIDNET